MKNKKKTFFKIWLILSGTLVALFCCAILKFRNNYLFLDMRSLNSLEEQLFSSDVDVLRESLAIMKRKGSTNQINRAIELLAYEDDYVWLAAANYLGKNGVTNSIPYLIKSLRHTAYRNDKEALYYLKNLTGVDNGTHFISWYSWWSKNNIIEGFDWDSKLGTNPRLGVVSLRKD